MATTGKRLFLLVMLIMVLCSCAPVLRQDIMEAGSRDVPFPDLRESPALFSARLFILGGIIVNTKVTTEGSLIEALYVPVDSRGFLQDPPGSGNRFLALLPKDRGLLDPMIYRKGRAVTLAGEFVEIREGRIDEAEYAYPFFLIREFYLWEEQGAYYPYYPYFPYYPYSYYPYWDYPYWWDYPSWRFRHRSPFWW